MQEIISGRINEVLKIIPTFEESCQISIESASKILIESFRNDFKLLICGNGGSAADSQHLAAEFVSSFSKNLSRRALPALALTVDSSILTAYSNDFNFGEVFARQVEAFGRPGDVLIAITTSGKSENCILACKQARKLGLKTIALTKINSPISKECDVSIEIPSDNTQHIQEFHMISYHILVEMVERSLFQEGIE